MIDISKHITMREAIHSEYAKLHGINNEPDVQTIKAMQHVAQSVFEPLRGFFNLPIKINSFFRNNEVNAAIGGAKSSQHVKGEAMDLVGTSGITNAQLFYAILKLKLPFDQLIWEFGTDTEPSWVHVSKTLGNNRYQVLRSFNKNGKTVYVDITNKP